MTECETYSYKNKYPKAIIALIQLDKSLNASKSVPANDVGINATPFL